MSEPEAWNAYVDKAHAARLAYLSETLPAEIRCDEKVAEAWAEYQQARAHPEQEGQR